MQVNMLSATMNASLAQPAAMLARITEHFADHAKIETEAGQAIMTMPQGVVEVVCHADHLEFKVKAREATDLAMLKYAVSEHVLELLDAGEEQPHMRWEGDCAAGSPLPYLRVLEVISVHNVTPHMRRIRLQGDDLHRFTQGGLHIRLVFPPHSVPEPKWPVMGEDGRPQWPEGDDRLVLRVYTIRAIDAQAGWVDVDMVVHEDCPDAPGSNFALHAKAGDIVAMTGPGGGNVAADKDWYLLAGDETALPAIGRILENLSPNAKAVVRIEVAGQQEEQQLSSPAQLDLTWLHRSGAAAGTTTLLHDAIRQVEFPTNEETIFVWAGCEFEAFRAIRTFIRKEKQIAREDHLVVAYWRNGVQGDEARQGTREA